MAEVFTWWNLVFLLPLGLSALLLLMNAIGIGGDAGADGDLDADVDADADLHADAHMDSAVEHDLDQDHDMDHDHDQEGGSSRGFLEFLGGGKIPITLIFQIFFFTWGVTGWMFNTLLKPALQNPFLFVWISIGAAFVASALVTRTASRLIARYAPLSETYAKSREEIIGKEGEAIYSITLESGMAQVYDERGTLHRIYCRIASDEETIQGGGRVLVIGYDKGEDVYLVKRSPIAGRYNPVERMKS